MTVLSTVRLASEHSAQYQSYDEELTSVHASCRTAQSYESQWIRCLHTAATLL